MPHCVKRAISLPREQDERLQSLAKRRKAPYSRLIQHAIDLFLRREEMDRIASSYKRYYASAGNAARERGAARDLGRLLHGG